MSKLTQAMLAAVLSAAVIATSPIRPALAQDDGNDQAGDGSGSDSGSKNEDSGDDDPSDDDGGGSGGQSGGETETGDNDHDFALKGVRAGRLFSLKVILKAARAQLEPGERILDVNLKQRRATPHYEVTILSRSGALRTLRFGALRPAGSDK